MSKFGDCSSKFVGEEAFLKKVCQKEERKKKKKKEEETVERKKDTSADVLKEHGTLVVF